MADNTLSDATLEKSLGQWRRPIQPFAPYLMLVFFGLEILLFSILAPETFANIINVNAVITNASILGLLVLAMLVPLIAGEIDASLAAVLTVTSLLAATMMASGWPLMISLLAAVACAVLVGVINGIIVVRFGVMSLITTLGTFTILTAAIMAIAGGRVIEVGPAEETLQALSEPKILGLSLPVYYLVVVAVIVWFVTERTVLGRKWQAVGSSVASARMAGLNTGRLRILAFTVGGLLAGIAGVVQLLKAQLGTPNIGPDLLFPALAACFLSVAAFRLGSFNVRGALLAIAVIQFGVTGLILIGQPYWVEPIFSGVALLISLALVRVLRQ